MEKNELLKQYYNTKDVGLREQMITEFIPLVKTVCGTLSAYTSGILDMEDLVSYGIFGLIDAIDKYDITKNIKFETYASFRIKGEVLDNIRKLDPVPRAVRDKERAIRNAEIKLKAENRYSEQAVADELGISIDELRKTLADLERWNMVWIDDVDEDQEGDASVKVPQSDIGIPESAIEKTGMDELKERLAEALNILTPKEKEVVLMIYYENLSQREASEVLGISGGRVSQLLGSALMKLREELKEYKDLFSL